MDDAINLKCPHCGSLIYSRRNVLCGVCGKRLPDNILFTERERERAEKDLTEANKRLRQVIRQHRSEQVPGHQ